MFATKKKKKKALNRFIGIPDIYLIIVLRVVNKIFCSNEVFPHCLEDILEDLLLNLWLSWLGVNVETISSQARYSQKKSEIYQLENEYLEMGFKGTDDISGRNSEVMLNMVSK